MKPLPPHIRHGTSTAYCNYACRCTECKKGNARRYAVRELRVAKEGMLLVSPIGARRRIQALHAMGWTLDHIAQAAGYGSSGAIHGAVRSSSRIHVDTATRIDAAYEKLCMSVGPSGRTRAWAKREGFAPPLAWTNIDDPAEQPMGVVA